MAFHELEDTVDGNLLFELPEMYHKKQMNKFFGISFLEFMELPMFYIYHLMKLADKYAQEEVKMFEQVSSENERNKNPKGSLDIL